MDFFLIDAHHKVVINMNEWNIGYFELGRLEDQRSFLEIFGSELILDSKLSRFLLIPGR